MFIVPVPFETVSVPSTPVCWMIKLDDPQKESGQEEYVTATAIVPARPVEPPARALNRFLRQPA